MKVIAIIAAFNEADIIGPVIGDLADQGVFVYLIDHGSTDDTSAVAEQFAGRNLLGVERFPPEGDPQSETFTWTALLGRKEALATELDAQWFIHHDADEFRESPWAGVRLVDAIERVDRAGYNAIDFELLNFFPADDSLRAGQDPRPAMRRCAPGDQFDKIQVKCWRKQAAAVDLVTSGGHDVQFPGRRVFPLRFLTRHYPIRSQAHGDRKVFGERIGRFDPGERAIGWHVQYEGIRQGHDFLERARTLADYDADRVRLDLLLRHRGVEELESALRGQETAVAAVETALESSRSESAALRSETGALATALASVRNEIASLGQRLHESVTERDRAASDRDRLAVERDRLDRQLSDSTAQVKTLQGRIAEVERNYQEVEHRIQMLLTSRSWIWTAPLRAIARVIGLRPPAGGKSD